MAVCPMQRNLTAVPPRRGQMRNRRKTSVLQHGNFPSTQCYAVAGLVDARRCFMEQGMRVIRLGMLPIPRGFSCRGLGAPHPRSVYGYGGAASPVVSHGGWSAPGCLRLRQKARGLGVSARWVKRWVSPGGQLVAARCLRSHNQSFVRTPGDVAALTNCGTGAAQLHRYTSPCIREVTHFTAGSGNTACAYFVLATSARVLQVLAGRPATSPRSAESQCRHPGCSSPVRVTHHARSGFVRRHAA